MRQFWLMVALGAVCLWTPGCDDDDDGAAGGTGAAGQGASGGQNTGGQNTGGQNAGGQNAGGQNAGGQNAGGQGGAAGQPGPADAGAMGGSDAAPAPDAAAPVACNQPAGPVSFTTEDGVTLQADWYPAAQTGAPAVALFHMIPPSNNRSNYPRAFIDALTSAGITVLNVDRRGAGASEGVAQEAYEGPKGRLDVVAALRWLNDEAPCAIDGSRLALVGASNGTTSILDYTLGEGALPLRALVLLTGGGYTENQNNIADHRTTLDQQHMQFVFSTAERAWSAGFQEGAPQIWSFEEFDPGAHGTRMFGERPESIERVAQYLSGRLAP